MFCFSVCCGLWRLKILGYGFEFKTISRYIKIYGNICRDGKLKGIKKKTPIISYDVPENEQLKGLIFEKGVLKGLTYQG